MDKDIVMSDIMIVTSSYNDLNRLTWWPEVAKFGLHPMLYHKDDTLPHGTEISLSASSRRIANFGKADYAFLHHIVHHYNNLNDHTIFVKCNWFENRIDLKSTIDNTANWDFLDAGTIPLLQVWNPNVLPMLSPLPCVDINQMYGSNMAYEHIIVKEWFDHIFASTPPDLQLIWGHGPCFAVSRRLIHRHSLSVYQELYDKFTPTSEIWHLNKQDSRYSSLDPKTLANAHCDVMIRLYRILFTHGADIKYKIRPSWQ